MSEAEGPDPKRMDDWVGLSVSPRRAFSTKAAAFVEADRLVVTGHYRGRLELKADDGRVVRKVRTCDVRRLPPKAEEGRGC